MRAMSKRDTLHSIGNQIGVGKESDIYIVSSPPPPSPNHFPLPLVLKIHRLGRISFRTVKANRDYMGKRKSASWMYMSRLAAQKEWAFMKVLWDNDFPVPRPIDQARHTILMEWVDGWPLRQVAEVPEPGKLYSELMDIVVRLAKAGLIHGDFNEFNILITKEGGRPVVIDFPQMVSTSHPDALWYVLFYFNCAIGYSYIIGILTEMLIAYGRSSRGDLDTRARCIQSLPRSKVAKRGSTSLWRQVGSVVRSRRRWRTI